MNGKLKGVRSTLKSMDTQQQILAARAAAKLTDERPIQDVRLDVAAFQSSI